MTEVSLMDLPNFIPIHRAAPSMYGFERRAREVLRRHLRADDHTVLDMGCGNGLWRFLFPPDKSYTGIDVVNKLFSEKRAPNVAFSVAAAENLPFRDESFDFILSSCVLEHVHDDLATVNEAFRVLRRGKYFFIVVPSVLSVIYHELPFLPLKLFGKNMGHGDRYYTRSRLLKVLTSAGFEIVSTGFSMGFWGNTLTILGTYKDIGLWYVRGLLNEFLPRPINNPMFTFSSVWGARNASELCAAHAQELAQQTIISRIYVGAQKTCYALDNAIPWPWGGEFAIVCKKP